MISNKCVYALKAVLELSLREHQGPISIQQIAKAQDIPARFLEAILRELKQNGITDSQRGKEGGYTLNRPSKEISVGEILRLIEGPLVAMDSRLAEDSNHQFDVFQTVLTDAEAAMSKVTDNTFFDELARKWTDLAGQYAQDYSI